jgi:Cof subfamily protein (haloacid dehalogenase superfamily)
MTQVIFLDVDGTLTNDNGRVPDTAAQAVKAARANGHKVYLCTGRSRAEILPEILEIGIDGIIGAGGSYLEHDEDVLFHHTFPQDAISDLRKFLTKHGVGYYLESNEGLFASKNLEDKITDVVREHADEDVEMQWFFDILEHDYSTFKKDKVNKVSFVNNTIPYESVAERFGNQFQMMRSTVPMFGPDSGEVALVGHDKQTAIEYLLTHMAYDPQKTVAVGDGHNDFPMFAAVNTKVAMGNAKDDLKAAADMVVGNPDENGIQEAFMALGLI